MHLVVVVAPGIATDAGALDANITRPTQATATDFFIVITGAEPQPRSQANQGGSNEPFHRAIYSKRMGMTTAR